ncbi:hypothetical protein FGG08_004246 [Glutinoglossum americanum]|uniref:NACHT domain-containing protein n=1 Tax=Glutinoglossum americanum TaxID=1670608 RepID=A0A9P8I2P7_9PEZI|nr:hypothetical protein FGG08_004246 [Glutinoglossum americanum]
MDMFRKHNHKFGWRHSEGGRDKDSDDEQSDCEAKAKSEGVDRPAETRGRASEPLISTTSLFPGSSTSRHRNASSASSRSRAPSPQPTQADTPPPLDPLGLTSVHTFPDPILDIIFVHGLGGTSIGTWSWGRDPANFWPTWLGADVELSRSRVFTFGYDAYFANQYSSSNILDFAKDLLFRMKTFSSEDQRGGPPIGKAYIIGKPDKQYADMIARVSAMVFLATPHKGSAYAQTLNSILKAVPGGSAKAYVAELEKNSASLQDINEQFRNICEDLELVSFHETLKTSLGPGVKKLLVDKDSSILGYPGETSSGLVADHHGMAKFKDPFDSNYIDVRNVLRYLMKKVVNKEGTDQGKFLLRSLSASRHPLLNSKAALTRGKQLQISNTPEPMAMALVDPLIMKRLTDLLGIPENFDDDLEYFVERTMPGSCQWLLRRQSFQDWSSDDPNNPDLLWLTGNPGSGKSTLAGFVITSLMKNFLSGTCCYHFFLAGNQSKRTVSYLLRRVALQAALSHDVFRLRLLELHENTGIIFSQQKATIIWEKIFEGILFRLPSQSPLYWVFDGLDEAESPTELIRFLSKIGSATRVKVLLVSRATKDLLQDINLQLPATVHETISADDTSEDIRDYVRSLIRKILPSDHAQEDVIQSILAKASGSFLWVKLALDRIRDNWHTQDDIRTALTEIPEGMEPLYERMIEIIASQPPKPREMATRILTWVACSFRFLDIAELQVALTPEFTKFVNLKYTVEEICGHFVVVNKTKIVLIHQTARQFLLQKTSNLQIRIVDHEGHKHIAAVCVNFLSDASKWRRIFSAIQTRQQSKSSPVGDSALDEYPFLSYALSFWAYHVSRASVDSDEVLETVLTFLEDNCLLWINGVALSQNLRILTQAAQHLKTYAKRRARSASHRPVSFALARDAELRQWAIDLIRLVGRFGNNITESPSSVHKHVVPFCPKDSIISQSFGHVGHSAFSVTGMSSNSWDDCLARLAMGEDQTATKLLCKDTFFITLIGCDGTLIIWRSETCEEVRRIAHGEWVNHMASSKTSNLVATAGFKTTRVWDITTGEELYCLTKESHIRTKALAFGAKDDEILIAYDDCSIQCIDLATSKEKWRFLAKDPGSEDHNCARFMSFSPDSTQIVIVFRGKPVLVWSIQPQPSIHIPPKRCVCTEDKFALDGDTWNAPEVALWHPVTDHLLILYEDTKILHWNIIDDEQLQYDHIGARAMVLSPDGNLLLTSDNNGTLSIWMVPEYRLTYRLKYDELVTDLAFSPEGTRFYDIRGTFCNVWEPDALIRPNDPDQEEMSSTYETIASEPVLSSDDNTRVPITALVCDSSGKFYCCGKEDGSVIMHDIKDGARVRKLPSHSSTVSVIKLAWSPSEKYFVSADDSGRIISKRLELPTAQKPKFSVFALFEKRIDEAVEHFLFSTRDEYLLIASPTTTYVMGLKSKQELCRLRHPFQKGGIWINHPTDPAILLRMHAGGEREYLWATLTPKDESPGASLEAFTLGEPTDVINRTVSIRSHWLVLETLANPTQTHSRFLNRHISLADLHSDDNNNNGAPSSTISKRHQIDGLAQHVRQLIGSFQDRVVFLDHHFWVCTWEVERVYRKHKRHFFLPKDWLSPMALGLLVLNGQGSVLCPRNGEVAVVKEGLKV